MNTLIMCSAVALNIFSAPAGNQVVGTVPVNKEVQLMDASTFRGLGLYWKTRSQRRPP